MTTTLCIDTSAAAVITLVDGGVVRGRAVEPHTRRHAESLGTLLREVVPNPGEIERICVGTGPGPYTGLRAGIAFASALGRGLGVPVLGVPSQDALALAALDEVGAGDVLVTSDAKRGEVYWGIYRRRGPHDVEALLGPDVGPLEEALEVAAKQGAVRVEATVDPALFVRLVDARPDGGFPLAPLYLRRPDVNVKKTQ